MDEEVDHFSVGEDVEVFVAHPVDDGKDDDADRHHEEEEGRSAAVVDARAGLCVFGGELHPPLEAGDGLMFGAVVHEHAADILHRGDGDDIQDKDDQPQPALREVVADGIFELIGKDEVGQPHGEGDEQPHREHDAEQRRDKGDGGHQVDVQLFFAPLFELGGLPFVSVHLRAAHEDLGADDEGGDEIDDAAHDGDLCDALHPL